MKKIYIARAVLATVSLASCQQEKSFEKTRVDDNTVVFGISRIGTRSGDMVVSQATLPGRIQGGNQSFILQETVELLDGTPVAETRGIPAYTENVGTLYGSSLGVYSDNAKFGDATYEVMSKDEDAGWRYHHNYDGNPWPDEDSEVDFYFRMPANMSGIGDGGFTYAKTDGKQTISFSYTTPATASAQQDILFGARSASKADYLGSLSNIPTQLQEELLNWLNRKSGYVFLNKYGQRITARGLSSRLTYYARKYGMNEHVVHPHAFRHLYAKKFLERYQDIALLADLLGHKNISTTRIYLRKSSTEQWRLINQIVDW